MRLSRLRFSSSRSQQRTADKGRVCAGRQTGRRVAPPQSVHSDSAPPGSSVRESSGRRMKEESASEQREKGERRRLPRLKIPGKIWRRQQAESRAEKQEEASQCEEAQQQLLEERSRQLISREEQLFGQEAPSEEEQDELQKDLEDLLLQVWTAVHSSFSGSSADLEALRSAVTSIQQQEAQDRRWQDREEGRAPVWRPQKCLSTHTQLLRNMVASRLDAAAADSSGVDGLSSSLKREVCRTGRRLKEDLLTVACGVQDCYPPEFNILNLYAGLYQQSFSSRLTELARSQLDHEDCSYLLLWVNSYYPDEILNHQELQGKVKTACLGSLLLEEDLTRLEEQYLTHKEDKVRTWLRMALNKERESWLSGKKPDVIDQYYFSPLAVDIIQVVDSSVKEASSVVKDQRKTQRITAHLDVFLTSYKSCLEEFLKGGHANRESVMKANLVCMEQLRDYITAGSLPEQQSSCCMKTLSALRDSGYEYFTRPIHTQLKMWYGHIWSPAWLDGSVLVVDRLLDSLDQQLAQFTDLKPACREVLLSLLQQQLLQKYVKKTMKMKNKMKSREMQVGGASRMMDDSRKINDFFAEGGCLQAWLSPLLCSLAEILRLQDPGSVQLETVSLARTYPDLSGDHVAALLAVKSGLSAADVRSIRRSVEENRLSDRPANHSPPFFSKVKVKWTDKINPMGLKH